MTADAVNKQKETNEMMSLSLLLWVLQSMSVRVGSAWSVVAHFILEAGLVALPEVLRAAHLPPHTTYHSLSVDTLGVGFPHFY